MKKTLVPFIFGLLVLTGCATNQSTSFVQTGETTTGTTLLGSWITGETQTLERRKAQEEANKVLEQNDKIYALYEWTGDLQSEVEIPFYGIKLRYVNSFEVETGDLNLQHFNFIARVPENGGAIGIGSISLLPVQKTVSKEDMQAGGIAESDYQDLIKNGCNAKFFNSTELVQWPLCKTKKVSWYSIIYGLGKHHNYEDVDTIGNEILIVGKGKVFVMSFLMPVLNANDHHWTPYITAKMLNLLANFKNVDYNTPAWVDLVNKMKVLVDEEVANPSDETMANFKFLERVIDTISVK